MPCRLRFQDLINYLGRLAIPFCPKVWPNANLHDCQDDLAIVRSVLICRCVGEYPGKIKD
jgi:hypothetical protein